MSKSLCCKGSSIPGTGTVLLKPATSRRARSAGEHSAAVLSKLCWLLLCALLHADMVCAYADNVRHILLSVAQHIA